MMSDGNPAASEAAAQAFDRARRKAFINEFLTGLVGGDNRLVSFHDLLDHIDPGGPIYRGMHTVAIDQIVGSVDRYEDFDRAFLPRQTFTRERWKRVGQAYYTDVILPPVQLYKMGEVYFVMDGNHRISVARELGQEFIDAEVVEYRLRVPLHADMTAEDMVTISDLSEFLSATGFDDTHPQFDFLLTLDDGYERLLDHIEKHRYLQGIEWDRPFTFSEAAAQWIEQVYTPVVEVIRTADILKDFPGRTETDLYLWLMEHLYYLRQQYGDEVDPVQAAQQYADHHSTRWFKRGWHYLRHHVLGQGDHRPVDG